MKNFSIQSCVLIMMMVAVSPLPRHQREVNIKKDLLRKIQEKASNLIKQKLPRKYVCFKGDNGPGCPTEVFCLAEKSLKDVNETKELHDVLQEYNKKTNVTCHLDCSTEQILKNVVNATKHCAPLRSPHL